MSKAENKLTIFLSHSHKDIDKVRKVRDLLETLNCEPIAFFLACMDENHGELEDLLKREIDARHVFVYCRSHNSEKSPWVAKELQYIAQSGKKRIYEINLDEKFESSIVTLLNELMQIIYRNTVIICRDKKAAGTFATELEKELVKRGLFVMYVDPTNKTDRQKMVKHYCRSGIFVPLLYRTERFDDWGFHVFSEVLQLTRQQENAMYLPVVVAENRGNDCAPLKEAGFIIPAEEFTYCGPEIVELIARMADVNYDSEDFD